jgi:hypothetical protein
MYHDQALIPVKTLAADGGVNVTLGLLRADLARSWHGARYRGQRHRRSGQPDRRYPHGR